MSETPLVRARGIAKAYDGAGRRVEVLRRLDLDLAETEAVAVVGASGVGKSTLLHVLGGLDPPDAGEFEFRGAPVYRGGANAIADHRNRNVGFVFQFHHLLPEFTALENVEMPFRVGRRDRGARARAEDLLARLGVAHRATHYPAQLSGGEQQRVAIARAVALAPALVLADEPTGNLDPRTGQRVFETLRDLQAAEGFTLVLATHSARLARGCDRVLRLDDGALRALAETEQREYFESL
jgi:lipoprotein-releasing system ATP-binding protein